MWMMPLHLHINQKSDDDDEWYIIAEADANQILTNEHAGKCLNINK